MSISIYQDDLPAEEDSKRRYKYFDTPDGQDGVKKLIYTTRIAGYLGTYWAITDIMLISKPKGVIPTIGRFAYIVWPFIGTASAFTITTYLATHVRQKDDEWNYFCGGFAAGAVYGTWRNNFRYGFNACWGLAIYGVVFKYLKLNGISLFPEAYSDTRIPNSDLWTYRKDYSITSDPPRTWTK